VFERVAQKERDPEQQNDQASMLQPSAADSLLQVEAARCR
jgi:hypothetical protein